MKIVRFFIFFLLIVSCTQPSKKIPIISKKLNREAVIKQLDSIKIVNQVNQDFNIESLRGKVHIVNFFFSTCQSICPDMESKLLPIVESENNTEFLSFTIDPEKDSVSMLKVHANSLGDYKNWMFLRTNKKDLKKIASIYLSSINNENEDSFYHTTSVVLIDSNMNIRGLYDVLIPEELEMLKQDLDIVLKSKVKE